MKQKKKMKPTNATVTARRREIVERVMGYGPWRLDDRKAMVNPRTRGKYTSLYGACHRFSTGGYHYY